QLLPHRVARLVRRVAESGAFLVGERGFLVLDDAEADRYGEAEQVGHLAELPGELGVTRGGAVERARQEDAEPAERVGDRLLDDPVTDLRLRRGTEPAVVRPEHHRVRA